MDFFKMLLEVIAEFFKDKEIVEKKKEAISDVVKPDTPTYVPYKGVPSGGKKLEPELIEWWKARLEKNPAYIEALRTRDARTICFLAAQAANGVREKGGNNKGKEVQWFQETIGSAQAEAWCMSFVQSCIAFAEYVTGIKSPIHASEHCMTVWNNTSKSQRVNFIPLKGAIAIWRHGTTSSGHTGIVESCDEKEFTAYEGNTEGGFSSSGAVVRDGGGVYHTKRNRVATGNMRVVGFLKPF